MPARYPPLTLGTCISSLGEVTYVLMRALTPDDHDAVIDTALAAVIRRCVQRGMTWEEVKQRLREEGVLIIASAYRMDPDVVEHDLDCVIKLMEEHRDGPARTISL